MTLRLADGSAAQGETSVAWATLPAVSLLTQLDAFFTNHRRCGELDAEVDGVVIWFDCECGARIARRAEDGDTFDVDA